MDKQADTNDILSGIGHKAQDAGKALSGWYNSIPEELRHTVTRGLVGAGAGAALTGGLAAASGHADREHAHDVKGTALLGAMLGGTAAAGLPLGMKLLSGGVGLGHEEKKPLTGRIGDKALGGVLRHPALIAGGAVGAGYPRSVSAWPQLWQTLKETRDTGMSFQQRLRYALATMKEKADVGEHLSSPGFQNYEATMKQELQAAGKRLNIRAGMKNVHPGRLAILPAALGAGYMADKYIKGDY